MIPALNLLPTEQKKDVQYTRTFLLIHEMLLFVFIATVISSAALLSARIMLENKFHSITIEETPGTTRVAQLNRKISKVNRELNQIQRATKEYVKWSPFIADLTARTPRAVNWHTFQILDTDKLLLTGVAQTREALVEFRDNLEPSPYVQSLELPLRYLTAGEDNPFNLEIIFDSKALSFPL